jgi:hypothetical protein
MTTVVPFLPSNIKPFSFSAIFDNSQYNVTVTWNVSSQRFFINIYDVTGAWILTTPMVQSPPGRDVESVYYDPFMNVIQITLVDPSLWPLPLSPGGINTKPGTMIDYVLRGFQPITYNGSFRALHINETVFTFPMSTNPGPLVIAGSVNRMLNMVDTIFRTSSLIYRSGAFEIDP